jgi:hypothetical protein
MSREERTDRNWIRVFALLTVLWTVVALPAWGQQTAHMFPWRSEHHGEGATREAGGPRPLAEVMRSSRPDSSLEGSLSGLPRSERLAPGAARRWLGREPFGLAAQAERLMGNLYDPAGSPRGLVRATRFALHALDAPGRALSRLTGADRASFNPFKKRVSFTWYVDFP